MSPNSNKLALYFKMSLFVIIYIYRRQQLFIGFAFGLQRIGWDLKVSKLLFYYKKLINKL